MIYMSHVNLLDINIDITIIINFSFRKCRSDNVFERRMECNVFSSFWVMMNSEENNRVECQFVFEWAETRLMFSGSRKH